jgi:hypothetical protein
MPAKPAAPAWRAIGIRWFLAFLAVLVVPVHAPAQDAKPIFDGRLTLKPTRLSSSEESLMKDRVLTAARKAWHERERDSDCEAGFKPTALDIAPGSFTKPKSDQKAILYTYCTVGHDMDLNGIAVIENGRVVAHIVYEGGQDRAIGALPDIDGNGLAEILVATGGTNQGVSWETISIIELAGSEITEFGQTGTSSDNCGIDEKNGKAKANRISVKPGKTPAFYREAFVNSGSCDGAGTWRKSGVLAPISLEEDKVEYELLK